MTVGPKHSALTVCAEYVHSNCAFGLTFGLNPLRIQLSSAQQSNVGQFFTSRSEDAHAFQLHKLSEACTEVQVSVWCDSCQE